MPQDIRSVTLAALAAILIGACATTSREPARPANAPAAAEDQESVRPVAIPPHTEADIRFMQQMIHHHAQALEMAALVPTHTTRRDLHTMAERITVSQRDEIAVMQQWLRKRGAAAPDPDSAMPMAGHGEHAAHSAGADTVPMMPGMLTPAQMRQLREAQGPAFDRLFLELMIQHHEGALRMVERLFVTPGAAQEHDVFRIASDINADQNDEIRRMRSMLAAMRG